LQNTSDNTTNEYLVLGILAHVDAGKTTLSEAVLYQTGAIRTFGRVDHQDAFLDTDAMERERGITIFSKQARFVLDEGADGAARHVTLLDTPGHVDFSAQMERTLPLLDYAVLVVSGADGVQAHTKTLWRLLRRYGIPVFLFINKMDQNGTNKAELLAQIKEELDGNCVDFGQTNDALYEDLAVCSEALMDSYLDCGTITNEQIAEHIRRGDIYPCYFGSALRLEGVDELLDGLRCYMKMPQYPPEFSARVYKIGRDEKGSRLTYMKITGGELRVRTQIGEEKVNQIRLYSGASFVPAETACAGMVCAVTGLLHTFAGQGLGAEQATYLPMLEPVLNYQVQLPEDVDIHNAYQALCELEEEEPLMRVRLSDAMGWMADKHHLPNEETDVDGEAPEELPKITKNTRIQIQMMGEIQCEIVARQMQERYGIPITFSQGEIVYKETVAAPVEGVGHYEPLRHYAEVHVLIEPGVRGSGIQVDAQVSSDVLAKNWQRLILTHLQEKRHTGVLTGSELTDVRLTLVAGKAHKKHTMGGDFRQATYRAVRQGLMCAENILLEPMLSFVLTLPQDKVGRAMADITNAHGRFDAPEIQGETAVLRGVAPVACMQGYQKEVLAYTKGEGRFEYRLNGYEPCHNTEEVLAQTNYDAQADTRNPVDSVFCAHGAGFIVPWQEVPSYMHVESGLEFGQDAQMDDTGARGVRVQTSNGALEEFIDEDELETIFLRTFAANARPNKKKTAKQRVTTSYRRSARPVFKDKYLLVDGYNIIFAWDTLKHLAEDNLQGARNRLMDMMCNYQAYRKVNLILVFDAYKVAGGTGEAFDYHNIHVVYTKEAQTADAYIEKFTHDMGAKYDITVATSDALEQLIVLGQGAKRISSRELYDELGRMEKELREQYLNRIWE
jgi:small GTP-binding protein